MNGSGEWTQKYGSILQTVLVLAIPFSAMWIGAIQPLQNSVDRLDKEKLTIREHTEYMRGIEKEMGQVQSELLRIRSSLVTKDEHVRLEEASNSRATGQANRLMKLEDELHGSANISKSIDRIQEHLSEIDRRLFMGAKDK